MEPFIRKTVSDPLFIKLRTSLHAASDSILLCSFLCSCKHLLMMIVFLQLFLLNSTVPIFGKLFRRFLLFFNIVPYRVRFRTSDEVDRGVLEMRSLLKGEDCFDYNLDQTQQRPFPVTDFRPYLETYLAAFHFKLSNYIRGTYVTLQNPQEPLCRAICDMLAPVNNYIFRYATSRTVVNLR